MKIFFCIILGILAYSFIGGAIYAAINSFYRKKTLGFRVIDLRDEYDQVAVAASWPISIPLFALGEVIANIGWIGVVAGRFAVDFLQGKRKWPTITKR